MCVLGMREREPDRECETERETERKKEGERESRLVNWANLRMIRLRRELSVLVRACFIFQMRC